MAKEDFWKEDSDDQLYVPPPPKSRRTAKPKKMEYDGWGSKPLIEFLKEIGKDTKKKISQQDLTTIVNEYVNKNNLIKPSKKKRVECDEWLRYLFGKKFVLRIKIHELLFSHLAENRDESSEDEDSNNSEEEENEKTASQKRKASVLGDKVTPSSKKVPETPKSCFASIIPDNIKLVYLRRSLIQELLKDPVTFESKVVGSYVRIKSDPHDFSQKNSHQLLQVTGVRKDPECGNVSTDYFLQVPHLMKEIPVSMLSNENFKTEECEDLLQRIKAGSANRPTVIELQQKAQMLHEVITKQGIVKELALLQNLIDRANEKGWRRELFEYLERKELLQKPAEQERLLLEVPNVIAEELEPEAVQDPAEDKKNDVIAEELEPEAIVLEPAADEKNFVCLPQSNIMGNRADIPFDIEADKNLSNDEICCTDTAERIESKDTVQKPAEDEKNNICCSPQSTFAGTWADIPCDTIFVESAEDEKNSICCLPELPIARTSADMPSDAVADKSLPKYNFCSTNAAGAYFHDLNSLHRTVQYTSDVDREGNRTYSNGATYVKETNGAYFHGIDSLQRTVHCTSDVDREGNRNYINGTTYAKETNGVFGVIEVEKLDIKKEDKPGTYVIELSDDDDDEEGLNDTLQIVDHPESKLWYYTDPQQMNQGPFSMVTLKKWKENLYFGPGFMIWKSGHPPVLLEDMIRLMFHN